MVRKCFGYSYIPQRYAMQINAPVPAYLNPLPGFKAAWASGTILTASGRSVKYTVHVGSKKR